MTRFETGMKVECIDDNYNGRSFPDRMSLPVRGEIYTIKRVENCIDGKKGLMLGEIESPVYNWDCGWTYQIIWESKRFRIVED